MHNLTASIPHQLTREEAKRRIRERVDILRMQHGSMLGNLKETWSGDRMEFSTRAMGQEISGHLLVDDQAVHASIALPWLLRMLAGATQQKLESEVRQLLSGPASTNKEPRAM